MRIFPTAIHPDIPFSSATAIQKSEITTTITRKAARAIVLNGENILLMYTKRYHDYTLPGGGVDEGESIIDGLKRELKEETGAHAISNITEFGCYEEFRPWYKDNADVMHMLSYCFTCTIDKTLKAAQLEDYEIQNGMEPKWVNIHQAIKHNENTIANSNKKGLSIIRETFLLKQIVIELITEPV